MCSALGQLGAQCSLSAVSFADVLTLSKEAFVGPFIEKGSMLAGTPCLRAVLDYAESFLEQLKAHEAHRGSDAEGAPARNRRS